MDERTLKTFNTISDLLGALSHKFPNDKPLALYNRLVDKITIRNTGAIQKHIDIFEKWCQKHKSYIVDCNPLPQQSTINYSDRIYVKIAYFIHRLNDSDSKKINQYLHTICALLIPDENILSSLEDKIEALKVDGNTTEGAFINDIMGDVKNAVENSDSNNPMSAIGGLFEGGFIQKITAGLAHSVGSGEMDMSKLFGVLQTTMSEMGKHMEQDPTPKIEEIEEFKPPSPPKKEVKEELDDEIEDLD